MASRWRSLFKKPLPSGENQAKVFRDHFGVKNVRNLGFPHKPTCLTYDSLLDIIILGTSTGVIHVYGKCGFHLAAPISNAGIQSVSSFDDGKFVALSIDGSVRLVTLVDTATLCKKSLKVSVVSIDTIEKTFSVCRCISQQNVVVLGAESGNLYVHKLVANSVTSTIRLSEMLSKIPSELGRGSGPVEDIQLQPSFKGRVLIGYRNGLIVLYNIADKSVVRCYLAPSKIESLCFNDSGDEFASAHEHGGYMIWSVNSDEPKEDLNIVYGPYPCKPMTQVIYVSVPETTVIFAGGMCQQDYGDRYTVSLKADSVVALDFGSRVIDMLVVNGRSGRAPHLLLILCDEELVAVDLSSEGWPVVRTSYLTPPHASPVTALFITLAVPSSLVHQIASSSSTLNLHQYSTNQWPIAGCALDIDATTLDVVLTGHENGAVIFWSVLGGTWEPICQVDSSPIFGMELPEPEAPDDAAWPPLRKCGLYDPYSDDPRLRLQKLYFEHSAMMLVAAGTAGHVVTWTFNVHAVTKVVPGALASFALDQTSFQWKGHEAMAMSRDELHWPAGFQPLSCVQLQPPGAVTTLAVHSGLGFLACGTAHGVVLLDARRCAVLLAFCTLRVGQQAGAEGVLSRAGSIKKSLRQSFRRLRKSRKRDPPRAADQRPPPPVSNAAGQRVFTQPDQTVERRVDGREHDQDIQPALVRSLLIASCALSGARADVCLWVGTDGGIIFCFVVQGEASGRGTPVVKLAKEIQLLHGASVQALFMLDRDGFGDNRAAPGQQLLVCSEEQLKIFQLPLLKSYKKIRITATDGTRIRRANTCTLEADGGKHSCLLTLNNYGELSAYQLPSLRKVFHQKCFNAEQPLSISTCMMAEHGRVIAMSSPSELTQLTLLPHLTDCYDT